MGAYDSEIISQREMDSSSQSSDQQQSKNQTLKSLGRQSSIYSLTFDEFQKTLYESGKNLGSISMDEFLNSIWIAEENQVEAQTGIMPTINGNANLMQYPDLQDSMDQRGIAKQHNLPGQGSLTIPEPLFRKNVEEVWSEIQKPNTTQKQSEIGKMTLEDFLVRAGVVLEQDIAPSPPQQPSFAMYQNNAHPAIGPTNFVARPVMAVDSGVGVAPPNIATYQTLQNGIGEAAPPGFMKMGDGYSQPPLAINSGVRLGNGGGGGGGFGQVIGSPVSPMADANQVDGGNQYGGDGLRGPRKRVIEDPVEKVVERRQRKMIKNRESAARSRAKKQAYIDELKSELNQLKEENLKLQQALAESERKRQQQYYEEEAPRAYAQVQSKAYKANEDMQA